MTDEEADDMRDDQPDESDKPGKGNRSARQQRRKRRKVPLPEAPDRESALRAKDLTPHGCTSQTSP